MKIRINVLHLIFIFVLALLIFSLVHFSSIFSHYYPSENKKLKKSVIYLVYSPYCPHCHHLIEYLDTKNLKDVSILKTTNGKATYECLLKENFKWNFGVPIVFAKVNSTLIVIEGYPSVDQDVNGYFLGKEKEEDICDASEGEKFFDKNGRYLFCKLPDGTILGNKYAIDYLLKICENYTCEYFCKI